MALLHRPSSLENVIRFCWSHEIDWLCSTSCHFNLYTSVWLIVDIKGFPMQWLITGNRGQFYKFRTDDFSSIYRDSGISKIMRATKETLLPASPNGPASATIIAVSATQGAGVSQFIAKPDCHSKESTNGDSEKRLPQALSEDHREIPDEFPELPMGRTAAIIFVLTAVTFTCSMSTGLVTIAIPYIATDTHLSSNLILWSVSTYIWISKKALLLNVL